MSQQQPQSQQSVILDELAQAIAATLTVAIPAFSQVGMAALLGAFTNLITHHSNAARQAASPNPAPILPPVPVVPIQ